MSEQAPGLPPAARAARLQAKFHREIPLSRHMGVTVVSYEGDRIELRAPLAPNRNDKFTGFAGSLNALMTLAGWGLVYLRLAEAGLRCDIVIHKGEQEFSAPVRQGFSAIAVLDEDHWPDFMERLGSRGRARIELEASIEAGGETAATLKARYVALRRG